MLEMLCGGTMLNLKLDKDSKIPIYQQITDQVKVMIERGEIKSDEMIPTEKELCETYNLSRTTIRQAMNDLERGGFIHRVRGKGSFVRNEKIFVIIPAVIKYYDEIKKISHVTKSRILKIEIEAAGPYIADKMNVSPDEKICKIKWVRYKKSEAVVFETLNILYSRVEGIEKLNLKDEKLIDVLKNVYKIEVDGLKEYLSAGKINDVESGYLNCQEGEVCLRVERFISEKGKVVDYCQAVLKGEDFTYLIEKTNFPTEGLKQ